MSYRGKCPICAGDLKVVNISFLECEKGDYACSMSVYETVWGQYDDRFIELLNKLLEDLTELNNVE